MIHLPSGNHADEFDPVAFGQRPLSPFPLVQSDGVVLDQDGLRLKTIVRGELGEFIAAETLSP